MDSPQGVSIVKNLSEEGGGGRGAGELYTGGIYTGWSIDIASY